jgi:NAD(P)H-hydrate epimerase
MLAARGAQSAGAGLVRLIVDPSVYPALAPGAGGVMVAAARDESAATPDRFQAHAILAGPGWGRGQDRLRLLEKMLPLEAQGIPLILDADAIALSRDFVFNGNALITPHPAEFAEYTGLSREDILADPIPILSDFALQKNINILLKGHVLYIASPARPDAGGQLNNVRIGVIDGMNPVLAAGGAGDVLAGFCAAIAARMYAENALDLFSCAAAAASLLQEAGQSEWVKHRFVDPLELAYAAAGIAGNAWLKNSNEQLTMRNEQ